MNVNDVVICKVSQRYDARLDLAESSTRRQCGNSVTSFTKPASQQTDKTPDSTVEGWCVARK